MRKRSAAYSSCSSCTAFRGRSQHCRRILQFRRLRYVMPGGIFVSARYNTWTRNSTELQARLTTGTGKAKSLCIVRKQRENECTSTFARYAIGSSAIEDHPPKESAVGDVLLGPGRPQSSAPTALFPAHPGHVKHLAPPVLSLLQPAVSSCKQRFTKKMLECRTLHV